MVSGRRGWRSGCRDAEREEQSGGAASGYVLQGCRSTAELRRLWNGESDLSLLQWKAAVSVWVRAELHKVQLQRSHGGWADCCCGATGQRRCDCDEHRKDCRRRGGSGV